MDEEVREHVGQLDQILSVGIFDEIFKRFPQTFFIWFISVSLVTWGIADILFPQIIPWEFIVVEATAISVLAGGLATVITALDEEMIRILTGYCHGSKLMWLALSYTFSEIEDLKLGLTLREILTEDPDLKERFSDIITEIDEDLVDIKETRERENENCCDYVGFIPPEHQEILKFVAENNNEEVAGLRVFDSSALNLEDISDGVFYFSKEEE